MKLVELSKKGFDSFAQSLEITTFQQSSYWAKFKEGEKWHPYYIALKEKNTILAGTLLLAKEKKPLKLRFFYAPRGFLIDYKNEELLNSFTKEIISFIKKKKGVLLKIDPYVLKCERDKNGEIVEGGKQNDFIVENLENVGFIKLNEKDKLFIQPKWLYQISYIGKTFEQVMAEMEKKTRQIIRKNEKRGFTIRELAIDEYNLFDELMNIQNEKYNVLDCTLLFYQDLLEAFGKEHMKIMGIFFDLKEEYKKIEDQLANLDIEKEQKIYSYHHTKMKESTFIDKQLKYENEKKRLEERYKEMKALEEKEKTDYIFLGAYLYLLYNDEIICLQGAIKDEYKKYRASYTLHYRMMKKAYDEGYKIYNFYEILGVKNEEGPQYGSYEFKRNFGGQVVELIGEFDLPILKDKYNLIKNSFPTYYGVRITPRKKSS